MNFSLSFSLVFFPDNFDILYFTLRKKTTGRFLQKLEILMKICLFRTTLSFKINLVMTKLA